MFYVAHVLKPPVGLQGRCRLHKNAVAQYPGGVFLDGQSGRKIPAGRAVCSSYVKDYRGTCLTRHYIRADAVEAVENEKKTVRSELRKSEMRIDMIPKLMGEKENEREEFIHAIRKFMEMRTLTKQVLNELIDHIDVYETQGTGKNKTQRLVIYYKFVGYLDIDPTQCHPNYTADIREGVAIEYVSCEPSDSLKELFPEGYGVVDDDSFEEAETE